MPITIPPNRKITIEPKQGGGYQSAGLPDGLPPGALTMGTTTKTATSITGVVTDGNGSTSYQVRVNGGTWQSGLTATGLTAETTYSVEWRGVNASGTGPATTPENVTTSAQAATGFTGANGETITLSGSGFGALANPLPSAFDTFTTDLYPSAADGIEVPEDADPDSRWGPRNDGITSSGYEFDSARVMPGRQFSAKSLGAKASLKNAKTAAGGASRATGEFYSSFWIQFNESLASPPQPGPSARADKILRVWDRSDGNGTRVSWEGVYKLHLVHKGGDDITDYDQQDYPPTGFLQNEQNQWHRCDYHCSVSSGAQSVWIDGKKFTYAFSKDSTASADAFYTRLIGHDVSQSSTVTTTVRHWLGEFYEQPTIARVELSNSAVYDDSVAQKRIYQRTETRTDTSITLSAYYADLDLVSPVYAHIIKSDGTVINWGQIN